MALVAISLFSAYFVSGQDDSFRVMTFNVRYDNPSDGKNAWDIRKALVIRSLNELSPEIVGMQEVLERQASFLDENLPAYAYVGVGRDDGRKAGEYSPVFYKKDRFEMVDWGTFWLSETPYDTGSVGWDAALPRICTWANLKDLHTGQEVFFLNTHFDHVGEKARAESARLIVDFIQLRSEDARVILTGDFNCTPYDIPYHILAGEGSGLADACAHPEFTEPCAEATFNGFGHYSQPGRIDMILFRGIDEIFDYQVIKARQGEMYVSDHWPVMVTLR